VAPAGREWPRGGAKDTSAFVIMGRAILVCKRDAIEPRGMMIVSAMMMGPAHYISAKYGSTFLALHKIRVGFSNYIYFYSTLPLF